MIKKEKQAISGTFISTNVGRRSNQFSVNDCHDIVSFKLYSKIQLKTRFNSVAHVVRGDDC